MLNGYVHRYFHLLKNDLFEMYFLLAFRALGFSMIGIFLPLFLYVELGYGLREVILFYGLMTIAFALSGVAALKVVSKFGVRHSMIYSYFFLIASFVMLIFLKDYSSLLFYIAFIQGFSFGLFWIGFHVDFALHAHKKNIGKQSGILSFSSIIGAVTGPMLGALLIKYFGFNIMFSVALSLFIISFLPLLFSKDEYPKTSFNLKKYFKKEYIKYFLGYFSQGIRSTVLTVFWPIFVYLILQSYMSLGWLATLSTMLIGIMCYVVGKYSDTFGKSKMIRLFAPIGAVFSGLRIFAWDIWSIFTIGLLDSVLMTGVDVPLLAKTYKRAKKEEIAGFIFFRETALRAGEVFILLFMLIFASLKASLVVSALSNLLYLLF